MALGPMMRRTLVAGLLVAAAAAPARAQALAVDPDFARSASFVEASDQVRLPIEEPVRLPSTTGWSAPKLHLSLATTFVGLQALDVATTLHAVHSGAGVEANPLLGGLAGQPAALIGLKAGLAAATILSMHELAKSHPKAAVLTMIGLNVGSAFVVKSNLAVATR